MFQLLCALQFQKLEWMELDDVEPTTLIKETLVQVFSCEFCEISTNTFFTEQLWTTASERDYGHIHVFKKPKTNFFKLHLLTCSNICNLLQN